MKDKYLKKNKKLYNKLNNLDCNLNKLDSKVKYYSDNHLKSLKSEILDIIGFGALNLELYGNKIRVFYPENKNDHLDEIIYFYFNNYFNPKKWNDFQKKNHLHALLLVSDFLNISIQEVDNYYEADLIVCQFREQQKFIGASTYPYELDVYRNLNNKLFIFYSSFPSNENSSRGTKLFYIYLHHILHCFGLKHNESEISTDCNTKEYLYYNSILSTIIHPDLDATNYPQTLMPLDIEALKFLYKPQESVEYLKWIDFNLTKGIIQCIPRTNNIELNSGKFSRIFNLSLDAFSIQNSSKITTYTNIISKSANDKIGGTILAMGNYYKQILVNYELLNIYSSNLIEETKIIVIGNKVKKINIYLQGYQNEYYIDEHKLKIVIIKKSTKGTLLVDTNQYNDVEVELFLLGSTILNKFPEKYKNYDNFVEDESENKIKIDQEKSNKPTINKSYFVDIKSDTTKDYDNHKQEDNLIESQKIKKQQEDNLIESQKIKIFDQNNNPFEIQKIKTQEEDIGQSLISNLREEHYQEIIKEFFIQYPESINLPEEYQTSLLNKFGINYIAKRFKYKLKGKNFPLMDEMLKKKKNEFKNTFPLTLI